jgi:hypothetical protein
MGEPRQRMLADTAIALADFRPVGVFCEPEKNTRGALVCALGQHDFIAFME